MMLSPSKTADVIARFAHTKHVNRARISEKQIEQISGRERLRTQFILDLQAYLDDLGYCLPQLDCGGFGLFRYAVLMGAPHISLAGETP